MKDRVKKNIGIILIGVGIVIVYELLTDVFGVLDTFLFVGLKTAFNDGTGKFNETSDTRVCDCTWSRFVPWGYYWIKQTAPDESDTLY